MTSDDRNYSYGPASVGCKAAADEIRTERGSGQVLVSSLLWARTLSAYSPRPHKRQIVMNWIDVFEANVGLLGRIRGRSGAGEGLLLS
jgi:hypothetical protein